VIPRPTPPDVAGRVTAADRPNTVPPQRFAVTFPVDVFVTIQCVPVCVTVEANDSVTADDTKNRVAALAGVKISGDVVTVLILIVL
jgi:hypothetical protein